MAGRAWARVDARLGAQGVAEARRRERRGEPTRARPPGRLVWFHAASVGESLSVLPLVRLVAREAAVLVTTGTATSAEVLARRLPPGAMHQFAPLDSSGAVGRFLDHWRPDLAVVVESEIWPQTLRMTAARGVPLVLMNARLSERTLTRWARAPRSARAVLGLFDRIVTQTEATREALVALGADPARTVVGGNMKASAGAPPGNPAEQMRLAAVLGNAPVWAAVSTHPGEEEAALAAHALLRARHPDARLILVPRHPERGDEVAALTDRQGMGWTRRSAGGRPTEPVYLADTLGETGLWFRLAPLAFLGGSFVPVGGHNPWEAAHCGAALLMGPLRETVKGDVAALETAGAARTVRDAEELGAVASELLAKPMELAAMREAGLALASAQVGRSEAFARDLLELLPA
nr:3-deoxy-D-manno-octulosonic acid transferase [Rubellimicrobium aerolatum]